jgi:type 2 lantibiotic biosynthesis protein LanM
MSLTKKEFLELIKKTSFLHDRINGYFVPEQAQSEEVSERNLNKWKEILAKRKEEIFQKRLSFDNLTPDTVRSLLGEVRLSDENNLPEWSDILEKIINPKEKFTMEQITSGEEFFNRFIFPDNPVPFEEAFVPFIMVARDEVIEKSGKSYNLAHERVHAIFEHNLLNSLACLCLKSIHLEFSIFILNSKAPFESFIDQLTDTKDSEVYSAFIREMLNSSFINFFNEYPVLARLVSVHIKLWVESISEFFLRLQEDLSEISGFFQKGEMTGHIISVKPSLSDRHNGGRTVIAVTFESGLKIIYKPKDLSLEEAYFRLLSWFNEHGVSLKFKTIKILNRKNYGWTEFVEYLPCKNEEDGRNYYRRAGQLLCLLYVLGCSDCHMENIIASGEYPVVVDLETLMLPQARFFEDKKYEKRVSFLVSRHFFDSVLRTGLLPRWQFGSDKKPYDISGLGSIGEQELLLKKEIWKNLKTDGIKIENQFYKLKESLNVPVLENKSLTPFYYKDYIIEGFKDMYSYLMTYRDFILATESPLRDFYKKNIRFVFRPTRTYGMILNRSLEPKLLRDPVLWSINIDLLTRAISKPEIRGDYLWPLIKSEIFSMEQLDIPYITTSSDSNALNVPDGKIIEGFFEEPGYDRVITCLKGLDSEDMDKQIAFIYGALYARNRGKTESVSVEIDIPSVHAGQGEFLEQALLIGKELKECAISFGEEGVTWIGYEYIPQSDRFQLQPLGYNLYNGICGVSLFLSALERVSGKGMFRKTVLSALKPLFKDLDDEIMSEMIAMEMGIGGTSGLGSIVYSLVSISHFLEMPEIMDYAGHAALLIKDQVERDMAFDIVYGSAGAITGLIKLYNVTEDQKILDIAKKCGEHLLANFKENPSGYRAWATLGKRMMGGFSHGVAGIAFSLLSLYSLTGETKYIDAVKEAILYENTLFSRNFCNWLDLRVSSDKPQRERFMTAWCQGAPGIALGRIGCMSVLDTEEIRKDIALALDTTIKCPVLERDHLCCGNLGIGEILFTSGLKLNRSDLKEKGLLKASQIVSMAKHRGSFYCGIGGQFDPGFFQGISGAGYELLRMIEPDIIPSVLLLE